MGCNMSDQNIGLFQQGGCAIDQNSRLWCQIKEVFVAQLGVDEARILPDARIVEDLAADDLNLVELVVAAEEEFCLSISDEDAESFERVGDYFRYLKSRGVE